MLTRKDLVDSAIGNWLAADQFRRNIENILYRAISSEKALTDDQLAEVKEHLGCYAAHMESAIDELNG